MKNLSLAGILVIWPAAVLLAFYHFFWRNIQPFDHQPLYPQLTVDNQSIVRLLNNVVSASPEMDMLDTATVVIVHWLDPGCRCSLFSGDYIQKLHSTTSSDSQRHLVLVPPGKGKALRQQLPALSALSLIVLTESAYQESLRLIPSAPAAMVFDVTRQQLNFLGPHTSGVLCGAGDSYIDLVLNNRASGFTPLLFPLDQRGCFCPW